MYIWFFQGDQRCIITQLRMWFSGEGNECGCSTGPLLIDILSRRQKNWVMRGAELKCLNLAAEKPKVTVAGDCYLTWPSTAWVSRTFVDKWWLHSSHVIPTMVVLAPCNLSCGWWDNNFLNQHNYFVINILIWNQCNVNLR
jgi:hypothetical protein